MNIRRMSSQKIVMTQRRFAKQERRWQRQKLSLKPTEGAGDMHRIPSPSLQERLTRIRMAAVIVLFAAIMAQVDSSLAALVSNPLQDPTQPKETIASDEANWVTGGETAHSNPKIANLSNKKSQGK